MSTNEQTPLPFVFFGTSLLSTIVLDELFDAGFMPSLIVAPPDKPKGRNLQLTPPLTKIWGEEHNVPVIQPETLTRELSTELTHPQNGSWDFFVVASYGLLLPPSVLEIPQHGVLNVHPSLLPKLRGAAPIQNAILENMQETGVTIMLLDEKLDHGPILAQATVTPEPWPLKARDLEDLLSHIGGSLLAETIPAWVNGDIAPEEQQHEAATYCSKIHKEDGLFDLNADPYQNYLKFCAYGEWPGTYFFVEKKGKKIRVKIADALFENGAFLITRVIPEGKKEMDYDDFVRGYRE